MITGAGGAIITGAGGATTGILNGIGGGYAARIGAAGSIAYYSCSIARFYFLSFFGFLSLLLPLLFFYFIRT